MPQSKIGYAGRISCLLTFLPHLVATCPKQISHAPQPYPTTILLLPPSLSTVYAVPSIVPNKVCRLQCHAWLAYMSPTLFVVSFGVFTVLHLSLSSLPLLSLFPIAYVDLSVVSIDIDMT